MGRHADALAEFQLARSMNSENLECLAYAGQEMADLGDRAGALKVIDEIVKTTEGRTEPALLLSFIYASLGDETELFRCLEEAVQKKCVPLYLVALNNNFERYKSNPRYQNLLRSMGIEKFAGA